MAALGRLTPRVLLTEGPGDAAAFARRVDGDLIIAGGDGTLFEVLQVIDPAACRLAVMPAGRGNALARDLGFRSLTAGLAAIPDARTIAIDLMQVEIESAAGPVRVWRAASSVAFGYPVAVTRLAGGRLRLLGRASYAAASLAIRPSPLDYTVGYGDLAMAGKGLTGWVATNTRYIGGVLAFPRANCTDGVFEAIELTSGWLGQAAHNLSALSGVRFYSPARILVATFADVRPVRPCPLMLDGELLPPAAAIRVRILPGVLRCLAPAP